MHSATDDEEAAEPAGAALQEAYRAGMNNRYFVSGAAKILGLLGDVVIRGWRN